MTTSCLTAALRADSDHVCCFGPDGTERHWPEIVAGASCVAARLTEERGSRWAVNVDDSFLFVAALLGIWSSGKTAVLAPRPLLEGGAAELPIDGVIDADRNSALRDGRHRVFLEGLASTFGRVAEIPATAQPVLYTSGSTGRPKEISRAVRNLEAEIHVFESIWGGELGSCRVFSTVSHRHVYGLLFRVLWPLLSKRPFATFDLQYPEQLVDGRGDEHVLISSPALLKRIGHLPDGAARWRAVYSSGGLLPPAAATDSSRVLGARAVEILGSTETSGVAWRRQETEGMTAWRPLPRVDIRLGKDHHLEVRSPFVGNDSWQRMGDMISLSDDGTFELLGRGDHVAKIEDKRVSLAEIERLLIETTLVDDAAAVALEDDARQYVGVLLRLSSMGRDELARIGSREFGQRIRQALRGRVESVALPRKIRYVEEIPVDTQGKRQQAKLKAMFTSA